MTETSDAIYEKAEQDAFRKLATAALYSDMKDKPEKYSGKYPKLNAVLQLLNASEDKKGNDVVSITVNPSAEVGLEDFIKRVDKATSKKWIGTVYFTFEQRARMQNGVRPPDLGQGFHCHILFMRGGKKPSEIQREFHNSFKDMIGNPRAIHIKYSASSSWVSKLNYLKGIKADPDKMTMIGADKVWREEIGMEPIYEKRGQEETE